MGGDNDDGGIKTAHRSYSIYCFCLKGTYSCRAYNIYIYANKIGQIRLTACDILLTSK